MHTRRSVIAVAAAAASATALVALTAATAQPAIIKRPSHNEGPRVTLVAQHSQRTALDASPDPAGKVIYFTTGGRFGPAIFSVPAKGGRKQVVLSGAPLRGPEGLAVSNDAKRLYVADRRAGHILVVPVNGASPRVLRGTRGTAPRGLEIQTRGGRDFVVFSGRSSDGRPAVMRISVRGAARPAVLAKGAPLHAPDGIAISRSGAIYVTDHGTGGGRALRLDGGRIATVAQDIRLGNPGGIALTLDEEHLLVSSLSKTTGNAQVLIVHLDDGSTSTFDEGIGVNDGAGGLHRARAAVPMGWADVQRPGRVYRVDP